jgi:hypothetical protein
MERNQVVGGALKLKFAPPVAMRSQSKPIKKDKKEKKEKKHKKDKKDKKKKDKHRKKEEMKEESMSE